MSLERASLERRPDATHSQGRFPEAWGDPPADRVEMRLWILANIEAGRELERRGKRPHWLAPLEQR